MGTQIESKKTTSQKPSFRKAPKEKVAKCGMFPSHMSFRPTRVNLPHPTF